MHSGKTDRRSRRTQQLIADAFVGLMLEKRYDDITVQDILDRADVGRSTFYAHFTDKENLLLRQLERVLHDLGEYSAHQEMQHGVGTRCRPAEPQPASANQPVDRDQPAFDDRGEDGYPNPPFCRRAVCGKHVSHAVCSAAIA